MAQRMRVSEWREVLSNFFNDAGRAADGMEAGVAASLLFRPWRPDLGARSEHTERSNHNKNFCIE